MVIDRTIVVVGSINADLIYACPRLPRPGETVIGGEALRLPGGKGANQAVAAARLGARVRMVGSVGDDEAGREQVRGLQEAGVDVSCIRTTGAPTGTAIVLVDQAGENQIVLSLGANACVDVEPRALVGADAVLTQLEIPLAAVEAAAALADGLFCLNAAPARDLPAALVARCDLIVVNEREQAAIHGLSEARLVAVTEGAAGATLRAYGHPVAHAAPPAVTAIDTVGAGDAFAAAITACLARGEAVEDALSFACAAGALATTRRGAQSALPTYEEVTACLQGAS